MIKIGDHVRIVDSPSTAHLRTAAGRSGLVTDVKYKCAYSDVIDSWAVVIDGEEFIVDNEEDVILLKGEKMSDPAKVIVEMIVREPKKHSVRYDGVGEEPGITSLYLMNQAVSELGEPIAKRIRVMVERMD